MPAVDGDGKPLRVKLAAFPGWTTMSPSLPLSLGVCATVAVTDWGPAVSKVTLNWAVPLVSVTLVGGTLGSLLVMLTAPLRLVSGVPSAFRAVMVKVSATPAVGEVEVALTARLGPAGTVHSSLP